MTVKYRTSLASTATIRCKCINVTLIARIIKTVERNILEIFDKNTYSLYVL